MREDKTRSLKFEQLENRSDLSPADYDGIANALHYLVPDRFAGTQKLDAQIETLDGALRCVCLAYPNWMVDLHGSAGVKGGHWRCTLRENDTADNDAAIGLGHAAVPSHAVLAALFRLTAILRKL